MVKLLFDHIPPEATGYSYMLYRDTCNKHYYYVATRPELLLLFQFCAYYARLYATPQSVMLAIIHSLI